MPDIDPAALSRTDSTSAASIGASALSKSLSISTPKVKPVQVVPRCDLEPLYTALKAAIGDNWAAYKDGVSRFILGLLNHDELCRLTEPIIGIDPLREHMHNQLLCGIHANIMRDPPDQPVASWVSANDKPSTTGLKQPTGDAAEQRLNAEVKALPPRVRQRLKAIDDDAVAPPLIQQIQAHAAAKSVPTTASGTAGAASNNTLSSSTAGASAASGGASASSSTGLNKDIEIRKRFNQPLISELRDLPPLSALTDRLLPISYEEGLSEGPSSPTTCAELLTSATEVFIKEILASLFQRTRSDVPISSSIATNTTSVAAAAAAAAAVATDSAPGAAPGPVVDPSLPPQITSISGGAVGMPGTIFVRTADFKRRVAREGRLAAKGEVKRNEAGLLPIEMAVSASMRGGRGAPGDLHIALELGDPALAGMAPWAAERSTIGDSYEGCWGDTDRPEVAAQGTAISKGAAADGDDSVPSSQAQSRPNGVSSAPTLKTATPNGVAVNGTAKPSTALANANAKLKATPTKPVTNGVSHDDPMDLDGDADIDADADEDDDVLMNGVGEAVEDWSWQGAVEHDRDALGMLLEGCLAVGR